MIESEFPVGTRVKVKQRVARRDGDIHAEVTGTIEGWEDLPTGSWYAHGKRDKLWLKRVKLRKQDREEVLLIIDQSTQIEAVEAGSASGAA